jgi:hypothetical protein
LNKNVLILNSLGLVLHDFSLSTKMKNWLKIGIQNFSQYIT